MHMILHAYVPATKDISASQFKETSVKCKVFAINKRLEVFQQLMNESSIADSWAHLLSASSPHMALHNLIWGGGSCHQAHLAFRLEARPPDHSMIWTRPACRFLGFQQVYA